MKKYGFMFVAMVAIMSVGLSSCNDDDETKEVWTYFDDEEVVAFDDGVGFLRYYEKEGRYGIWPDHRVSQSIPSWAGVESGIVYLIYGEDESSEELEDLLGKRCLFSGSYQKIKEKGYGIGGDLPVYVTYYKTIVSEISEDTSWENEW